jgi:hypothetical protein
MRTLVLAVMLISLVAVDPARPQDAQAVQAAPLPISAIELEGSGGWPGQFWRISFNSDYTSEWFHQIEPREGNYVGKLSEQQWHRLVDTVDRLGIGQLAGSYASSIEDDQRLTLRVTRGAATQTVQSSDDAGPTELWALHMVMRGMAERMAWKRVYKGKDK